MNEEEDLFQLLDIAPTATDQEVKKAYRKKALTCHPDKSDGPDAAALFGRYKKAAELLLDPEARKSYEKVLRAKKDRQEKDNSLDSTRKKFKNDLEAREKAFEKGYKTELDEKAKLAALIERLQREGSRAIEKENEKIKKLIVEERLAQQSYPISAETKPGFQIKVSWRNHPDNLNHEQVEEKLKIFGTISSSFLSDHKKRGIVEFANKSSAEAAINSPLLQDFNLSPLFDVSKPAVSRVAPSSNSMPSTFGTSEFERNLLAQLKRKAEESKDGS